MSYFDSIPQEMVTKTLFKLDLKDIINFCQTDKTIDTICNIVLSV